MFGEDRNSQTDGTFPVIEESVFRNNNASKCGGAICWYNGVIGNLIDDEFIDNSAPTGAVTVVDAHANQTEVRYKHGGFDKESDHHNDSTKYSYWDSYSDAVNLTKYQDIIYDKSVQNKKDKFDINPYSESNTVCYVDINNKSPYQVGKDWLTAYTDLQDCIDYLHGLIVLNKEIWVKAGTYIPTRIPDYKVEHGKQRTSDVSFMLYPNINIYGGFDGTETHRDQRNILKNPTILSCYIPPPPTMSPTKRPTTARPTKSPITARPTLPPKTPRPTKAPVTEKPTRSPVTARPTHPPKTPKPTIAPTWPTPGPTRTPRPTTPRPSKSPITMKPTKAPKTERPTKAPVIPTLKPTKSPVTMKPTKAPKIPTQRPTKSPVTMKPTLPPKTARPT